MEPEPGPKLETLLVRGVALYKRGELAEAEALFNAVLATERRHPVALYLLGRIAVERSDWPMAEQLFRRALELAPGHSETCVNLAQVLRAQFRPAEAIGFCQKALENDPADTSAALELAMAQEETGQMADAECSYRGILSRHNEAEALLNLTRLLAKTGRAAEAERMLKKALSGDEVG